MWPGYIQGWWFSCLLFPSLFLKIGLSSLPMGCIETNCVNSMGNRLLLERYDWLYHIIWVNRRMCIWIFISPFFLYLRLATDHYSRCRGIWHHWGCEAQDPRQGRNPPWSAAFDLCRKAAWRWSHFGWLQHSKVWISLFYEEYLNRWFSFPSLSFFIVLFAIVSISFYVFLFLVSVCSFLQRIYPSPRPPTSWWCHWTFSSGACS